MAVARTAGFVSVALGLLVGSAGAIVEPGNPAGEAVLQRDEEMAHAVVAGDLKRLEDVYAPDYVYVGSDGRQTARAERLEAFRTGRLRYVATKHTDTTVRVYGDTAVVQGVTHSKVISNGREINGDFRYVGVWILQGGKWRIVLTQAARISG